MWSGLTKTGIDGENEKRNAVKSNRHKKYFSKIPSSRKVEKQTQI